MEIEPVEPDDLTQQFGAFLDWAEATLTQAQLDLLYAWLDVSFEFGPGSPESMAKLEEIERLVTAAGGPAGFQFLN